MSNLRKSVLAGVMFACTGFVACGGGYYQAGVVIGPPPPAPMVVGPVGYAPGPGYVWADGYYDLRGSNWVWVNGSWARRPYRDAVWVRPYWERHGRAYRFHKGRWRH